MCCPRTQRPLVLGARPWHAPSATDSAFSAFFCSDCEPRCQSRESSEQTRRGLSCVCALAASPSLRKSAVYGGSTTPALQQSTQAIRLESDERGGSRTRRHSAASGRRVSDAAAETAGSDEGGDVFRWFSLSGRRCSLIAAPPQLEHFSLYKQSAVI